MKKLASISRSCAYGLVSVTLILGLATIIGCGDSVVFPQSLPTEAVPECPAPTELDAPGGGTKYRFIPENFLDIGNRWEYRETSEAPGEPEAGGESSGTTMVMTVTGSAEFGGYDTRVVEFAFPTATELDTELNKVYWYMTSDDLVEAGFEDIVLGFDEDEYEVEQVRCDEPGAMLPIWVYSTDDVRHFGHGLSTSWDRDHPLRRTYKTWDTYVTFLGTESITVPAGQFDCVKVEIRNEFHDDDESGSLEVQVIWSDPGVGLIKIQSEEQSWDSDGVLELEETGSETLELIDTNVAP